MRVKTIWRAVAVLAVVLIGAAQPWAALAQVDLGGEYIAEDGSMTFRYPAGWVVQTDTMGLAALSNTAEALASGQPGVRDVIMMFFSPEVLTGLGADVSTLEGALEGFLSWTDAVPLGEPSAVALGEREGQGVEIVFGRVRSRVVALMFADGVAGVVTASTTGSLDDFAAVTESVMATWDRPRPEQAALSDEPCEVSTQVKWGAVLRVGPGENRTELSSLPTGEWFPVTGMAEADDGSLWWQLDKQAVAPESAAAELWVRQDQVDERGGCALVGTAEAPPIIPIPVQAPAPVSPAGQAAAPVKPSSGGQGLWIEFAEWNALVPPDLKATSRASARVVITVLPSLTPVAQELYSRRDGSLTTVYRMRVDYTLTALDPKTNAVLGTTVLQGGDPPGFPDTMPINATLNGPAPSFDSALGWMQGFLG